VSSAAMQFGLNIANKKTAGTKIVPAVLFYYSLTDPFLS
jgi:hypothetical protein